MLVDISKSLPFCRGLYVLIFIEVTVTITVYFLMISFITS